MQIPNPSKPSRGFKIFFMISLFSFTLLIVFINFWGVYGREIQKLSLENQTSSENFLTNDPGHLNLKEAGQKY